MTPSPRMIKVRRPTLSGRQVCRKLKLGQLLDIPSNTIASSKETMYHPYWPFEPDSRMNEKEIPRNNAAVIPKVIIFKTSGRTASLLLRAKSKIVMYWNISKILLAIRIKLSDCIASGALPLVSNLGPMTAKPTITPNWSALQIRSKMESTLKRASKSVTWSHVNQRMVKKPT